jgi:hypothetical protein
MFYPNYSEDEEVLNQAIEFLKSYSRFEQFYPYNSVREPIQHLNYLMNNPLTEVVIPALESKHPWKRKTHFLQT